MGLLRGGLGWRVAPKDFAIGIALAPSGKLLAGQAIAAIRIGTATRGPTNLTRGIQPSIIQPVAELRTRITLSRCITTPVHTAFVVVAATAAGVDQDGCGCHHHGENKRGRLKEKHLGLETNDSFCFAFQLVANANCEHSSMTKRAAESIVGVHQQQRLLEPIPVSVLPTKRYSLGIPQYHNN